MYCVKAKDRTAINIIIKLSLIILSVSNVFPQDITVNSHTTWATGEYTYDNVAILNNAVLTFNGSVKLTCQNLTIYSGSGISADSKGYAGGLQNENGKGPGGGTLGAGGGYGGNGGDGILGGLGGTAYGSMRQAVEMGSGGGGGTSYNNRGGSGGGAIILNVGGTLRVDGFISANGAFVNPGGAGSGGGIHIVANAFEGVGKISANGGNGGDLYGNSGAGGGGRISIHCQVLNFTGTMTASGGSAKQYRGGAGTVFVKTSKMTNGELSIAGLSLSGANTPIIESGNFDQVTVNRASVVIQAETILETETFRLYDYFNIINMGELRVANTVMTIGTFSTVNGRTLIENAEITGEVTLNGPFQAGNITVRPTGRIIHLGNTDTKRNWIEIVADSMVIEQNAQINADGRGYAGGLTKQNGKGAGAGLYDGRLYGSGGAYGGVGGAVPNGVSGGYVYGSIKEPVDLGSGGGGGSDGSGGSGGGMIKLTIDKYLLVEGAITGNGRNATFYNGGGGSGGSIFINAGSMAGNGAISANGGMGGAYGDRSGGGGRISIDCPNSQYSGSVSAYAGNAKISFGGSGTVFLRYNEDSDGILRIDNLYNRYYNVTPILETNTFEKIELRKHAKTVLTEGKSLTIKTFIEDESAFENYGLLVVGDSLILKSCRFPEGNGDVQLENATLTTLGDVCYEGETVTVKKLDIKDGSHFSYSKRDLRIIANNVDIAPNGSLLARSGFQGGQGPGSGGGGGSYGGYGNTTYGKNSGKIYGSTLLPLDLGSGGSNSVFGLFKGGDGGGALYLKIKENLNVDGVIDANGKSGNRGVGQGGNEESGGGSGGSIYIMTGSIGGSGKITANGGSFSGMGGGHPGNAGGGGRIGIYYNTYSFSGVVEANGGAGFENKCRGSVIRKALNEESSITYVEMIEKRKTTESFSEAISSVKAMINEAAVVGDLTGSLDSTSFEIVTIKTGPLAGKGYFDCYWKANLNGIDCNGKWEGVVHPDPDSAIIRLEGRIYGDLTGTASGYLSKSNPGGASFDVFNGDWKAIYTYNVRDEATLKINGPVSWGEKTEYAPANIDMRQVLYEGEARGYHAGEMDLVLTQVHIKDHPILKDRGFSFSTYQTALGTGQGFTIDKTLAHRSNVMTFNGIFSEPFEGMISAYIDSSDSRLILAIDRPDFGSNPMEQISIRLLPRPPICSLAVRDFVIEVRNEGLVPASNLSVFFFPPTLSDFVYSSGKYDSTLHMVRWDFSEIAPKSRITRNTRLKFYQGIPDNCPLSYALSVHTKETADDIVRSVCQYQDSLVSLEANARLKKNASSGNGMAAAVACEMARSTSACNCNAFGAPPEYPIKTYEIVEALNAGAEAAYLGLVLRTRARAFNARAEGGINAMQYWMSVSTLLASCKEDPQYFSENYPNMTFDEALKQIAERNNYQPDGYDCSRTARDPNEKLVTPDLNVYPGEKLNYVINYENVENRSAYGVYIIDEIDNDLDISTVEINNNGILNQNMRTVMWFIGELEAKQKGSVTFSANMKNGVSRGTEIINWATVHFPSVPETTPTNVVVSVYPANRPPVADAGTDKVVWATSIHGAQVQLDGSGSTDPDGNPLTYSWLTDEIQFNDANAVKPTALFPIGKTLVTLSVSDGEFDSSPDTVFVTVKQPMPDSCSIFATNSVWLKQDVKIVSGGVGVNNVSTETLDSGVELSIEQRVSTPVGYYLKANRMCVKQSAVVKSSVFYNQLDNRGSIEGVQRTPLVLPLYFMAPPFKSAQCSQQNINVASKDSLYLDAGEYGDMVAKDKAVVVFNGGIYHFNNIDLRANAKILFKEASDIRVVNRFSSGNKSYIGPIDTLTLKSYENIFYIAGFNGKNGKLDENPRSVDIGQNNTIFANIYAPNGTVSIGQKSYATGSFIGKDLIVWMGSVVRLDSYFKDRELAKTQNDGDHAEKTNQKITVDIPKSFKLHQNYPNPFNPNTTITFQLPASRPVSLKVYNSYGQEMAVLIDNEYYEAGYYRVVWNGKDKSGNQATSGVYLLKLTAGGILDVRKMTLLK